MIHTSYVPLEHPYQIIEYNGTIGIQIGTLIVVEDKSTADNEYAIKTHSHPVVSYVNNRYHPIQKKPSTLSMPKPYEGVVWDKVELHQVRNLIRENEQWEWQDFMDYCCKLRLSSLGNPQLDADIAIFDIYGQLQDWGIEIIPPQRLHNGEIILKVEVDTITDVSGIPYYLTRGDLGLVVGIVDDGIALRNTIEQVRYYLDFMNHFGISFDRVKFWTQNLFLQDFTEKLKKHEDLFVFGKFEEIDAWGYETNYLPMAAESDNL